MAIYMAFVDFDAKENGYDDIFLEAGSKEEARNKVAGLFEKQGYSPVLSDRSEEVWFTDKNGDEIVYFGFDEWEG